MPTAVVAGAIAAAGSVAGGIMGSSAAGNAASAQANAANNAAALNYQAGQNALDFQRNQWNTTQGELAPYLESGYGALNSLDAGMGIEPLTARGVPVAEGAAAPVTGDPDTVQPLTLNTSALESQPAPGNTAGKAISLATMGMFGGANPNQVPAASLEQSFEAAADNLNALARSGYITSDEAVQGMKALENSANSYLGGQAGRLGTPAARAIANADKVIGNEINGTQGVAANPNPNSGNLSDESKLFIQPGTGGWYGPAITNSEQLTDQILSQLNQPQTQTPAASVPLATLAAAQPAPTRVAATSTSPGVAPKAATSTEPTGTPLRAPNPVNMNATAQPTSAQNIGTAANIAPTALNEEWTTPFVAPTAEQAAATPGYQFQLQQGEQAIQRSAAAQGNLLTGGTAKDLNDYAQGVASENYQQVYNNSLRQYQNAYNVFQNNQNNQFNRLSALSGTGQTAASQLGELGQSAANTNANTLLTSSGQMGNNLNNAAAATASGYVGGANAVGGAVQGGLGNLSQMLMLSSLLK